MPKKRDPDSRPAGDAQRILLERLDEMGVTMKAASVEWLKRNHAYLRQYIFEGVPQFLDEDDRIALAFRTGLTEEQIGRKTRTAAREESAPAANVETPPARGEKVVLTPYQGPPLFEQKSATIPVYSAAQGGKGHWVVHFEALEYRAPPEDLQGVRDAYGILIRGESMIPAYKPGEIAWVHPFKTAKPGDDVVLYHVPPHGEAEAMVKELLGSSPKEWRLRQYNPPEDFAESRKDWPVCHLIVGKKKA